MAVTPESLSHAGGAVTCTATLSCGPEPTGMAAQISGGDVQTTVPMALAGDDYQAAYTLPANYSGATVVYTVTVVATDGAGREKTLGEENITVVAPPTPPGDGPDFSE